MNTSFELHQIVYPDDARAIRFRGALVTRAPCNHNLRALDVSRQHLRKLLYGERDMPTVVDIRRWFSEQDASGAGN